MECNECSHSASQKPPFQHFDAFNKQTCRLSSRYGHAIVRVLSPPNQPLRHLRLKNTMTPPVSSGIQVLCFLDIDPLRNYKLPPPLPPSTFELPPNINPHPLQISTLPSSKEIKRFYLALFHQRFHHPTILFRCPRCSSFIYLSNPLPPSSSTSPLTLPPVTCHRTSESIGLEAQHFSCN